MDLPVKALIYSQLHLETEGPVVKTSANKVKRAHIIDADGKKVQCFYKALSDDYPAFLAKNCVGVSVKLRRSLGDRVAEERLVFSNDKKRILGTISIGLENFLPLKFKELGQYIGLNPSVSAENDKLTNPDVNTLLEYNVAELLVAQMGIQQDDFHPAQMTLRGPATREKVLISWKTMEKGTPPVKKIVVTTEPVPKSEQSAFLDQDMATWGITGPAKGERYVEGVFKPVAEKSVKMKSCYLDNFPIRDEKESPTYHPTHRIAGNLNPTKIFASVEAFRALAANPYLEKDVEPKHEGDPTTVRIEFQEQFFYGFLKHLLTYDEETERAAYNEYLGDLPLDFKSLPPEKVEGLLRGGYASELFTDTTDKQPFAEYMAKVSDILHQQMYRVAVFYPGTKKNAADVPVVSFKDFLHNKPTGYRRVKEWIRSQNNRMDAAWTKHKTEEKAQSTDKDETLKPIRSAYCMPPEAHYNAKKVDYRYNGIWRDAHLPLLKALMKESADNIHLFAKELNIELNGSVSSVSKIDETNITTASEFLGENKISIPMNNEMDSNLKALQILMAFHNELAEKIQHYMELSIDKLTEIENQKLIDDMQKVIREKRPQLIATIGSQNDWSTNFLRLINKFEQFFPAFNMYSHSAAGDKPLHHATEKQYEEGLSTDHTQQGVVIKCLKELFAWADEKDREEKDKDGKKIKSVLVSLIDEIIANEYTPSSLNVLANRKRNKPLRTYLKQSKEKGSEKLAYILSFGGQIETSLNTKLIKRLIPKMIEETKNQGDVHIVSLRKAIEHNSFNKMLYTREAINYVKTDPSFSHINSKTHARRFNEAMYHWMNTFKKEDFKSIVDKAWLLYDPPPAYGFRLFSLSNKTRNKEEIDGYFISSEKFSNAKILAYILGKPNSGFVSTSYNYKLFTLLLKKMQSDINGNKIKKEDPLLKLILEVQPDNATNFDRIIQSLAEMTSLELIKSETSDKNLVVAEM